MAGNPLRSNLLAVLWLVVSQRACTVTSHLAFLLARKSCMLRVIIPNFLRGVCECRRSFAQNALAE